MAEPPGAESCVPEEDSAPGETWGLAPVVFPGPVYMTHSPSCFASPLRDTAESSLETNRATSLAPTSSALSAPFPRLVQWGWGLEVPGHTLQVSLIRVTSLVLP